ncbi:hypothetical protein TNCV_2826751 [Trichonephila clavipes]|nr:hypothetical protein TNCV_2826751 [Trichonephila clavipes]
MIANEVVGSMGVILMSAIFKGTTHNQSMLVCFLKLSNVYTVEQQDNLSCEENCSGGAVELDIICGFCSYNYKFGSSKKCKAEIGKPMTCEVNTRLVYAMRCIGKGAEAARMFCGIMNLPPPDKVLEIQ